MLSIPILTSQDEFDYNGFNEIKYTVPYNSNINLLLSIEATNSIQGTLYNTVVKLNGSPMDLSDAVVDTVSQTNYSYQRNLEILKQFSANDIISVSLQVKTNGVDDIEVNDFLLRITDTATNTFDIYRNHIINDFIGDAATMYNIPITPKRILQRHLEYVLLSTYGSTNDIKFLATDFASGISSKCAYENLYIDENDDQDRYARPSQRNEIFLPATIECDTVSIYNPTFESNKYKYIQIEDEKTGKIYEGWINSITFAPTKNKTQKLILQAKTI